MRDKSISVITLAISSFFALASLFFWFSYDPTANFTLNVPGQDNKPADLPSTTSTEIIRMGQFFLESDGIPSQLPGEWPQFRGPNSDNISRENQTLAETWGGDGPELLWTISLGEGHAAPAVKNGRVYLLDYDEDKKADTLRCFSLADGKEIWRRWYTVNIKRNHGISRTVPAVTDNFVVTIGPRCHVMCTNAISGDFLWGIDLEKDYNSKTPFWYTGQCPLIDDGIAVIAPAGKSLLIGVNCETGQIEWETPNPKNWKMSHTSVVPMRLNGKRMYVYSALGGMVGVSAEPQERGKVLWQTSLWNHSVLAPSPVIDKKGRIFLTAGYGAGSMMLKVTEENGKYSVQKLQEYKPKDGLASEQQTPILYNGHLFAIQPKDAGALREEFVCYNPDDCTQVVWSSGKTNRFGLGPYLIADGKIFILNDDGVLTMAKVSTKEYIPLAQAKVLHGHDAWGPIALAGGRLLVRDSKTLICLNIQRKQ